MNENEIQQRIRSARDILVGVVPDPKGQVDQITTALAYKFMADQDAKAVADGGKPTYFVGGYARFAWKNLMDAKIGGQERFDLYMRAIEAMAKNENLPPVFRQMFKGAFLPFRDLQILHRFLKEIDDLHYENVADLGDAYEHLLGVMSSQGAAGQFRTPRHIVEFIVDIVDPQKSERIHDPACGTGGFLIAAFHHILAANTRKILGDSLSASEKRALTKNIIGWDLDPGMTRLSLVNMYLRGITQPKIGEYDTLTSDDRWDDDFDVVLANPPFMTPKGGVRPHKRFSLRANRAEILFVDYIAEHLTPRGRAGIVVPDGVLFRVDSAHKKLREHLINDWGLWAVASLPSGVFNPYSGVKTSILFLDKLRAKTAREILFVKIKNDGFDLGAQRRPIGDNDLPEAAKTLTSWKGGKKQNSALALWVRKSKIAESNGFSLTADRYRAVENYSNSRRPMVRLGRVCGIVKDKPKPFSGEKRYFSTKAIGSVGAVEPPEMVSFMDRPDRADVLPQKGDVGFAVMKNTAKSIVIDDLLEGAIFSTGFCFLRPLEKALSKYLFMIVSGDIFQAQKNMLAVDGIMGGVRKNDILQIKIPLPPLEQQQRIVVELVGYQKVVDGARQLVNNWIPRIKVDINWPVVRLNTVCQINPRKKSDFVRSDTALTTFLPMSAVDAVKGEMIAAETRRYAEVKKGYTHFNEGDVLFAKITPCMQNGKHFIAKGLIDGIGFASTEFHVLRPGGKIMAKWLHTYIRQQSVLEKAALHFTGSAGQRRVPDSFLESLPIPLPSLEEQRRMVAEIAAEEEAVVAARRLLDSHERKICDIIADIWGKNGEAKK